MKTSTIKARTYKGVVYRSIFERDLAEQITKKKVKFKYEHTSYEYDLPVPRTECGECGSTKCFTTRWYTPDFFLSSGIIIEAKGKLDRATRAKMVAVRKDHPDIDLRIVFMRNNKITKQSNTRYQQWAERIGYQAAVGTIPESWLKETKDEPPSN